MDAVDFYPEGPDITRIHLTIRPNNLTILLLVWILGPIAVMLIQLGWAALKDTLTGGLMVQAWPALIVSSLGLYLLIVAPFNLEARISLRRLQELLKP